MKKISFRSWARLLLCALLLLTLTLHLPQAVLAAEKYMECSSADVSILLDEDGGATITETWDCYFGGDPITRYRRRNKNPDPANCTLEVMSVEMDGVEMPLLDAPDESRPAGCAAVYEEDGKTILELYPNAQNESRTFTIIYYMKNAVTLYDDVAEFRWGLVSEKESFDIDSLTAQVTIPTGTADRGLSFWAHGTPEGATFEAQNDDNGSPTDFFLNAGSISRGNPVSIRFAMPRELFPGGTRLVQEEALDRILSEEHALMDPDAPDDPDLPTEPDEPSSPLDAFLFAAGNTTSSIVRVWGILADVLCMAPILVCLLFSSLIERLVERFKLPKILARERLKPYQAPEYYRTLPDQTPPALVTQLLSFYPLKGDGNFVRKHGNAFSATILDLAERDLIHARRDEDGVVAYRVTANPEDESLTDYERVLLDLFSGAGADQEEKTTTEITQYMRDNYSWCKKQYRKFESACNEAFEAQTPTVTRKGSSWSKKTVKIISIVFGLFLFVGFSFQVNVLAGAIVALPTAFIGGMFISMFRDLFHPSYDLLTQEGENRYALWKAYMNFLNNFTTFQQRDINDLSVWRRHLVYATALGCSKQVIENLKVSMPEVYDSFISDPYLSHYDDLYSSVTSIDEEGGYTIYSSSSDSGSSGSSDSDDWGGCSSDGGSCDTGSDGSDFD